MEEGTPQPQSRSTARVRYGVHNRQGDIAGKTIGQVRNEMNRTANLPSDTSPFKGSERLDDDYVIKPGDSIEFHRRQGEKG